MENRVSLGTPLATRGPFWEQELSDFFFFLKKSAAGPCAIDSEILPDKSLLPSHVADGQFQKRAPSLPGPFERMDGCWKKNSDTLGHS